MAKIDIFSGFLGAGKTTLIKKLIKEAYSGEKLVLIENEFGSIGIDGDFLKDSGIEINELNSGCICCSLVGDFSKALKQVIDEYNPNRILIEPSGVGKLSDVVKACMNAECEININGLTTIVDANKCKMYMKNFGEFFNDQIKNAKCIILSHTDSINNEKLKVTLDLIKEQNSDAVIITTPWDKLDGKDILLAIENINSIENELEDMKKHHHEHDEECHCHEHHHEHDEECHCHEHHHEHDEECHCHVHHHEHDEECHCHEHHHEHNEECHCHEHHHDHDHNHDHDHHHADEVFTSWGEETVSKYSKDEIENILSKLDDEKFGMILRAKGIVEATDGKWIHFDYIPNMIDVRYGGAAVCGRVCVIGSNINEEEIKKLFK